MQTVELVHFILRRKAADFGSINSLPNGLSFNIRETVMGRAEFMFVRPFGEVLPLPF